MEKTYSNLAPRRFEIDRDRFQDKFAGYLESLGADGYGQVIDRGNPYENRRGGISTPLFEIWPYWWGDEDKREEIDKPNFVYWGDGPDDPYAGLAIEWYKYALRSGYANMEVSQEMLDEVFGKCIAYLAPEIPDTAPYDIVSRLGSSVKIAMKDNPHHTGVARQEEVVYQIDLETNFYESTHRWFACIPHIDEPAIEFRDGKDMAGYASADEAIERIVHYWTEGRGSYDPL